MDRLELGFFYVFTCRTIEADSVIWPFKQGTSSGTIREVFKKTGGERETLDPFMGTSMTALIVGSCLADLTLCCGDSPLFTHIQGNVSESVSTA